MTTYLSLVRSRFITWIARNKPYALGAILTADREVDVFLAPGGKRKSLQAAISSVEFSSKPGVIKRADKCFKVVARVFCRILQQRVPTSYVTSHDKSFRNNKQQVYDRFYGHQISNEEGVA